MDVSRPILVLIFLASTTGLARPATRQKAQLETPEPAFSLRTLEPGVVAMQHFPGFVFFASQINNTLFLHPYRSAETTRATKFGSLIDAHRFKTPNNVASSNITGMGHAKSQLLLLDGSSNSVAAVAAEGFTPIAIRSLSWDKIKPARDHGGEPPRREIERTRNSFAKEFRLAAVPQLVGVAALPQAWEKRPGLRFLVSTRLPSFPLVVMQCADSEPSQCVLERSCFVEGAGTFAGKGLRGVAVSSKRRQIILGDRANHRLAVFKFHSCFHVSFVKHLGLPPKLKELNNIAVDEDDALWVATARPDDYTDASVFYWPAERW